MKLMSGSEGMVFEGLSKSGMVELFSAREETMRKFVSG